MRLLLPTSLLSESPSDSVSHEYDVILNFPADKYPETATHILSAIKEGESAFCTIDRNGADENRDEALAGIETKDGFDRDEWPMAMCAEGGVLGLLFCFAETVKQTSRF
ncbi:hypothetical protein ASG81_20485 [Paenibacillus sp. Soil522]|nr:hypothetical protein [Paenibacillus sp. Soil522]KRE35676.1 hypothetical protein ASG81_20485 [Paenibacillus sp. Soil522]